MTTMSPCNLILFYSRNYSVFRIRTKHVKSFNLNSFYLRNVPLLDISLSSLVNSWRFSNYITYYTFIYSTSYLNNIDQVLLNLAQLNKYNLVNLYMNTLQFGLGARNWNIKISKYTTDLYWSTLLHPISSYNNMYETLFIIYLLRKIQVLAPSRSVLQKFKFRNLLLTDKLSYRKISNLPLLAMRICEQRINSSVSAAIIYRIRFMHNITVRAFNKQKSNWKIRRISRLFTLHNRINMAYYTPCTKLVNVNRILKSAELVTHTTSRLIVSKYLNFYKFKLTANDFNIITSTSIRYLLESFFSCPILAHYSLFKISYKQALPLNQISKPYTNLVNTESKLLLRLYSGSDKAGADRSFATTNTYTYFAVLIRFLEFCTGLQALLFLERHILRVLTSYELLVCILWSKKLAFYRRLIGYNLFIGESLQILWIALKLRDPEFFLMWLKAVLGKISFWKHRLLLRYFQYIFIAAIKPYFKLLNIRGLRLTVKGKISAAGNSRKRVFRASVGKTSFSELSNKIVYKYLQVSTFTGSLGLKFWICFNA